MSREETLNTRFGEMVDLISCLAVFTGSAEEKKKLTFDEILQMR